LSPEGISTITSFSSVVGSSDIICSIISSLPVDEFFLVIYFTILLIYLFLPDSEDGTSTITSLISVTGCSTCCSSSTSFFGSEEIFSSTGCSSTTSSTTSVIGCSSTTSSFGSEAIGSSTGCSSTTSSTTSSPVTGFFLVMYLMIFLMYLFLPGSVDGTSTTSSLTSS